MKILKNRKTAFLVSNELILFMVKLVECIRKKKRKEGKVTFTTPTSFYNLKKMRGFRF